MRRSGLAIVAVALCTPQGILAQTIRFNFDAVSLTYQAVREGRSSTGQGGGGVASNCVWADSVSMRAPTPLG